MGLLIPAPRSTVWEANFSGRPSATGGTGLTAHGTPHTLVTPPTEVIASTAFESNLMRLRFMETVTSATITDFLVNVYVGGSGSEVLLIDSLLVGWSAQEASFLVPVNYEFPVRIPRGTRISMAARALIASDTCRAYIELMHLPSLPWSGTGVETLGELTATSRGTQVTPGSTSEGTFTSIGTSGRRYGYIHPMARGGPDTSVSGRYMMLDIGTGSAALPDLSDFMFTGDGTERFQNVHSGRFCDIQSGTALQARLQSSSSDVEATSVCLYGVY